MSNSKIYTKSKKSAKEYAKRDALWQSQAIQEHEKSNARKNAESVIYAHVSDWVGEELEVGRAIPMPREHDKGVTNIMVASAMGSVPQVWAILEASKLLDTPALKTNLSTLEKIQENAANMRRMIAKLDAGMMAKAKVAARNLQPSLEGRIVDALGADVAAYMGLEVIEIGTMEQIEFLKAEIKFRPFTGAGRARNEAAHRVALEAARLFAKVTGEKPTYSESQGMLFGRFTPFLRDIYDAFGWKRRSLRTGAEAAIASLTADDFGQKQNSALDPFLTYNSK